MKETKANGFVPKNRYLYEQYHGVKLDDIDDVIIFLDDDYTNFSIENLYLMKRSAHAIMISHGLTRNKVVSKKTLIKFCEWKEKIFNLKRKGERKCGKLK